VNQHDKKALEDFIQTKLYPRLRLSHLVDKNISVWLCTNFLLKEQSKTFELYIKLKRENYSRLTDNLSFVGQNFLPELKT
jgi:hypothetical protein